MADHDTIDHAAKSLDLLVELDRLEAELITECRGANRREVVAELNGRIGRCMKRSQILAEHATRQEIRQMAIGLQMIGLRS